MAHRIREDAQGARRGARSGKEAVSRNHRPAPGCQAVVGDSREGAEMIQWEYDFLSIGEPDRIDFGEMKQAMTYFNTRGFEGWELVVAHGPYMVFKRPFKTEQTYEAVLAEEFIF